MDFARDAVDAGHLADAKAKAMPVGMREVADLVVAKVHAAGGDLMQLGLPDVAVLALDEGDLGLATTAERVAQAGGELESARTTTDDDDAVRGAGGALIHPFIILWAGAGAVREPALTSLGRSALRRPAGPPS